MKQYLITPKAKDDLIKIGIYTEKAWGVKQQQKYLQELVDAFSWLSENPYLGKPRNEIKQGYRSYQQGKHIIFYLIHDDIPNIIGILHENMDFEKHL